MISRLTALLKCAAWVIIVIITTIAYLTAWQLKRNNIDILNELHEVQQNVRRPYEAWDSARYLYLVEYGYASGVSSCAFYPLWPLTIRWATKTAGGKYLITGLILANLLSLSAWTIFQRLTALRWDKEVAQWAVVLLVTFPGSLFYQFLYSESLFLLLIIGLWFSLERRIYILAAFTAFLLPLTRAIGVFSLLPIGWYALREAPPAWLIQAGERFVWLKWITPEPASIETATGSDRIPAPPHDCMPRKAPFSYPWLLLSAPILGWVTYLILMWHWTGNPFEGFEAQKHWGAHSISNLWNVPKFIIGLFSPTQWHEFTGSLLDRCVFVLLLYCLPLIWKLDKSLFVWTWMLGIIPAMSGTFTSFTRYASCVFPMFIALAVFVNRPGRQWLRWGLLAVFAVLHVILVWRFVNFRWAG